MTDNNLHKCDNRVGPRLRRQQGFYNPREVALECKINHWTFYDLVEKGAVQRPLHRLAKSYYYSTKDVEEIKKQLKGSNDE
jgi:hypothetical protein